jgi:hypothetical protein
VAEFTINSQLLEALGETAVVQMVNVPGTGGATGHIRLVKVLLRSSHDLYSPKQQF